MLSELIDRLGTHLRRGTLVRAVRRRLGASRSHAPNRYTAASLAEGAAVLADLCAELARAHAGSVLLLADNSDYARAVFARLRAAGVSCAKAELAEAERLDAPRLQGVACIALAVADSKSQLELARQLVGNPATADIPLEYVAVPRHENAPIAEWDRLLDVDFVSPLLARHGDALFNIYREALTRFTQKTEIRDFLDLSQLLQSLVDRSIPGNVAEFGSFRGHSGYLASRVLELFGSDKTLFMFDMFENFPAEDVGVDRFWSGTHPVNFEEVRAKFADRRNVRLVKGDFTQTVFSADTGPLALAFIDCDSYRATRVLLETLWSERLSRGGIVALEDYGHAALLGNRIAVHDFFDGRRDAYTWFSQFSGFFVAVKL